MAELQFQTAKYIKSLAELTKYQQNYSITIEKA